MKGHGLSGKEILAEWDILQSSITQPEHAAMLGLRYTTYSSRLYAAQAERRKQIQARVITDGVFQRWDDHITVTGDVLVLSDVETPYHNSQFVTDCVKLASYYGITQLILAGDFVHFANFSHWGADFQKARMTGKQSDVLVNLVQKLDPKLRDDAYSELEKVGIISGDETISEELAGIRKTVKELSIFQNITYIMGNHEKRKLLKQEFGESADELLRFIGAGENWKATPYYWCKVVSGNKTWRIEHPVGAGPNTARDLAVQYHCHIAMGHSHRWSLQRDPSGDFYALQMGHCVDERKLAYVMRRSAKRDAHALGALIIRNGFPLLLSDDFPFSAMMGIDV